MPVRVVCQAGLCLGDWQDILRKDHFYEHLALGQGDLFGEVLDRHHSNAQCGQVTGTITCTMQYLALVKGFVFAPRLAAYVAKLFWKQQGRAKAPTWLAEWGTLALQF